MTTAAKNKIKKHFIFKGGHNERDTGMCAMEWASYLAGREHSAAPICVAEDLRDLMIGINDTADDKTRQRLRPFIPRVLRTRSILETEQGRAFGAATDAEVKAEEKRREKIRKWAYKTILPMLLDEAGLTDEAKWYRKASVSAAEARLGVGGVAGVSFGVPFPREFFSVVDVIKLDHLTELLRPTKPLWTEQKRKKVEKQIRENIFEDLLPAIVPPLKKSVAKNPLVQEFLGDA